MRTVIYFFVLFCSSTILAQINSMSNERVFGGSGKDNFRKMIPIPNSDNSFIFATSSSNISTDKSENSKGVDDIWLLKLDVNNNIIWEKTIGGSGSDFFTSAILIDSMLYISSVSQSPISGDKTLNSNFNTGGTYFDSWILCLDLDGNILWQKVIASTLFGSRFLKLQNGNLLIGTGVGDVITRLDEINPVNGDSIITTSFNGNGVFKDFVQVPNGEIYLLNTSDVGITSVKTDIGYGQADYWLLKLTENYVKVVDKCFGGLAYETAVSISFKNDFLYLVGLSNSNISGNKSAPFYGGQWDCWVVKTDLQLNVIWDKSYGGDDYENPISLTNTVGSNDFYLNIVSKSGITGNKSTINYGLWDTWVVRIDEAGNIKDQANIGGWFDDYGQVYPNVNLPGQNFFAGTSLSPISGIKTMDNKGLEDIWLFNFNADELLSINETTVFGNINVFPNPFQDKVTFSFPEINETLHLKIFTLDGKTVYESSIEKNTLSKEVNLTDSKAIYFYEISGEKVSISGKLVKVN